MVNKLLIFNVGLSYPHPAILLENGMETVLDAVLKLVDNLDLDANSEQYDADTVREMLSTHRVLNHKGKEISIHTSLNDLYFAWYGLMNGDMENVLQTEVKMDKKLDKVNYCDTCGELIIYGDTSCRYCNSTLGGN